MYLAIFLADFAVFRVFLGISRDFAEIPEFRGSATARNIRSPVLPVKFSGNFFLINLQPMQMYVCWCSGKSIAKTKTNHYNIFKTCNYYYNEAFFSIKKSICVLVDKLWAGLLSYKNKSIRKLYRKSQKKFPVKFFFGSDD